MKEKSMRLQYFTLVSSTILVFAVSFTGHGCQCDEAQSRSKSADDMKEATASEKAEILRQYFELEGITADIDSDSFVDRYGPEILAKMSEMLEKRNNLVEAFTLNCKINSMLYNAALGSPPFTVDQSSHLSPVDEATLTALDLIVPDSKARPIYALAKKDLRQFCADKLDLCEELLQRIRGPLADQEFYTMRAILYLESIYYNWIPLARLTDHIQSEG